jgi:hypothetical protein
MSATLDEFSTPRRIAGWRIVFTAFFLVGAGALYAVDAAVARTGSPAPTLAACLVGQLLAAALAQWRPR